MKFKNHVVPTGNICIMNGEKDLPLEFLSIGDYGKEKNIKANFLGLDKEINGVPHGDLISLEEKWVITISSQYGCSMSCNFCDVPKVGKGINATYQDLLTQVTYALSLHPEVTECKRLNLHYARMGEPTFNKDVINSAYYLKSFFDKQQWGFHPVVSTIFPHGSRDFIKEWLKLKNNFNGDAGLQLSINTTDDHIRYKMMPCAMAFPSLSHHMKKIIEELKQIKGRKITLNFALTDAPIDAEFLRKYFDPEYYLCKITPMHKTESCIDNNMLTDNGYDFYYPYKETEEKLRKVGYDVIVFVPSKEEDESKITCGNAILAETTQNF